MMRDFVPNTFKAIKYGQFYLLWRNIAMSQINTVFQSSMQNALKQLT